MTSSVDPELTAFRLARASIAPDTAGLRQALAGLVLPNGEILQDGGQFADTVLAWLEAYRAGGAPWRGWPVDEHARRLVLQLAGTDAADEIDRHLAPVVAAMRAAGHSDGVAEAWTEEVAAAMGVLRANIALTGGTVGGRA